MFTKNTTFGEIKGIHILKDVFPYLIGNGEKL